MQSASPDDSSDLNEIASTLITASTAADFLSVWLTRKLLSSESQNVLDNYYRNFKGLRSPRLRYFYNSQLKEAEELLRSWQKPRLLEIGVGTGTECLWFALNGADVTGIDVYSRRTKVANERLKVLENCLERTLPCRIETVPLLKFSDQDKFDVIWLEQAFHHLEPRAQVIEAISKLLRPGGYVVLSEANALNPLLQLQLFRIRRFNMFKTIELDNHNIVIGNERVLSARALERNLARVGVTKKAVRYFRLFPSGKIFEPLFGIERRLTSPWLAPIYTHYNFVGQKLG